MGTKARPKDMTEIESILEKNNEINYYDRWHPTSVGCFEKELSRGAFRGLGKEVRKNIAYSLQYLQFLQIEIEELHLHNIVDTLVKKSYIVTAMGIIEAILLHLVKSNGYQKKEAWSQETPIHTNVFKENGVKKKYIITQSIELAKPIEAEMDFEFLINKVQEKKLLNLNYQAFPLLKGLKRIRNKVHLQIVRYDNDTDYMSISIYDYWLMRTLLYLIIRNSVFDPVSLKTTCLSFIRPEDEQIERLKEHLKKKKEEKKNQEEI